MVIDIIVYLLLLVLVIKHPEKIISNEFLVSKTRLRVIAQELLIQHRLRIVEMADKTVKFDKFDFHNKISLSN